MEAKAVMKSVRMGPRKMRVVANMVRGNDVASALGTLQQMPKKAARIISKAVWSAAANAEDLSGGNVDSDKLFIKSITVDGGPVLKRFMPRAQGRATRIRKRTSHLTVVVSDGEKE